MSNTRYAISKSNLTPGTTRSIGRGLASAVILLRLFSLFSSIMSLSMYSLFKYASLTISRVGPLLSAISSYPLLLTAVPKTRHILQFGSPQLQGFPLNFTILSEI
jgi:hypothetical protein